jgi:hypothetical protein
MLKCILAKKFARVWIELIWLLVGTSVSLCCNEPWGSIRERKFDWLSAPSTLLLAHSHFNIINCRITSLVPPFSDTCSSFSITSPHEVVCCGESLHSCSGCAFLWNVIKAFRRTEPHKPALILRNAINYISLRIICVGNALVKLYQEMVVVYFTFDLFCLGDRLLLWDETYVWASTRRSGTDQVCIVISID